MSATQELHRMHDPDIGEFFQIGDPYTIWVSKSGSDEVGDGSVTAPYLTITTALAAVTATRKNIFVGPGAYAEAACLDWPTVNGVVMVCLGNVTISTDSGEDQVVEVAPGAQDETFVAEIDAVGSLCIDHANTGQDGIKLTHTSVGKKMNVILANVYSNADSNSDKFITVTHGGSGNAVRIYMTGRKTEEIEGAVYFETKDGGDRFEAHGCWFEGGIETSADAVALNILLMDCVILHEGVSGGHADQDVYSCGCFSNASRVFAAVDTNEFGGSHTEALLA